MRMSKLVVAALVAGASAVSMASAGDAGSKPSLPAWLAKVDPWVLATGSRRPHRVPGLPRASRPTSREPSGWRPRPPRGATSSTASPGRRTARRARSWSCSRDVAYEHRPFWVANMIWVRGDLALAEELAGARRRGPPPREPDGALRGAGRPEDGDERRVRKRSSPEWRRCARPSSWAAGFRGQSVVVGGQDTGYDWDHPALRNKYRGWNGSSADHNYNWHDAIHSPARRPPAGAQLHPALRRREPRHAHHGHDGGRRRRPNQVGVAPGARWIGCRNMDRGNGTPATYSECFQWFIAPTDLNDQNPDPAQGAARDQQLLELPAQRGLHGPQRAADGGRQHPRGGHPGRGLGRQQRLRLQHGQRPGRRSTSPRSAWAPPTRQRRHRQLQQPRPGDGRRQQPAEAQRLGSRRQRALERAGHRLRHHERHQHGRARTWWAWRRC